MKKFITALAATFATVVIGSAASAAAPATFAEVYGDIAYHEEVVPMSAPATFSDVYGDIVYHEEVVPVADADPFSEHVVGGLGPQLPYDPMRGVDYGFVQALLQQNADPFAEEIVGGLGPQGDIDPFAEEIVGGLGPQGDIDPFAEEIVGGLGPQINFVAGN